METKVYSKNDILQKLAQDGFFVDYLTLDSFLRKYKIEAIFEDENGSEFFDKSAYDILVANVLKKPVMQQVQPQVQQEHIYEQQTQFQQPVQNNIVNEQFSAQNNQNAQAQIPQEPQVQNPPPAQEVKVEQEVVNEPNKEKDKKVSLENIKWYRWDDVSADLTTDEVQENVKIIQSDKKEEDVEASAHSTEEQNSQANVSAENINEPQTQATYWNTPQNNATDAISEEQVNSASSSATQASINEIMATPEGSEDDFDDIELLSDSIQAQEKFQKYIVNELAKKNIDLSMQKPENAFKFDISEKTLNMIARAIAKKIAKQVSAVLSNNDGNNVKLIQAEKRSQALEQKIATLEEQNKKLKLLLVESNKNLNSYKPTFFGFYRFVRNKTKKRK